MLTVRNIGCSWNKQICNNAAKNGHLEVLQWDKEICENTAESGNNLELIQWIHEN